MSEKTITEEIHEEQPSPDLSKGVVITPPPVVRTRIDNSSRPQNVSANTHTLTPTIHNYSPAPHSIFHKIKESAEKGQVQLDSNPDWIQKQVHTQEPRNTHQSQSHGGVGRPGPGVHTSRRGSMR